MRWDEAEEAERIRVKASVSLIASQFGLWIESFCPSLLSLTCSFRLMNEIRSLFSALLLGLFYNLITYSLASDWKSKKGVVNVLYCKWCCYPFLQLTTSSKLLLPLLLLLSTFINQLNGLEVKVKERKRDKGRITSSHFTCSETDWKKE